MTVKDRFQNVLLRPWMPRWIRLGINRLLSWLFPYVSEFDIRLRREHFDALVDALVDALDEKVYAEKGTSFAEEKERALNDKGMLGIFAKSLMAGNLSDSEFLFTMESLLHPSVEGFAIRGRDAEEILQLKPIDPDLLGQEIVLTNGTRLIVEKIAKFGSLGKGHDDKGNPHYFWSDLISGE